MEESGVDSTGEERFANPQQLWEASRGPDGSHSEWYSKAVTYWDQQEASCNGVLGGFGHLSEFDISDSRALLLKAMRSQLEEAAAGKRELVAVDCGAGVGRVSEQLLLHHFQEVDLVEPSQHLLDKGRQVLSQALAARRLPRGHRLGRCLCMGLEAFAPEPGRYDCIWIQWCLLYLTDDDLLALFQRCKVGLKPGGIIMVKENVCRTGFIVDRDDSSLTRSSAYMADLFGKASMRVAYSAKQRHFPRELFEVRMWVLRPADGGKSDSGGGGAES